MFSKDKLRGIESFHPQLSEELKQMEKIIRDFESKQNDSDEYRALTQFEKDTYRPQILDFKTHTISLIGLTQTYLAKLIKQEQEPNEDLSVAEKLKILTADAAKKSIIETGLPEVLNNLILNLTEFNRVVGQKNNDEKVQSEVLQNLDRLKREVEMLKPKGPAQPPLL